MSSAVLPRRQKGGYIMEKRTVTIPAISCMHCVMTIKRELGDIDGVMSVEGDHATKEITVTWQSPATWEAIAGLLTEIGYPPAE